MVQSAPDPGICFLTGSVLPRHDEAFAPAGIRHRRDVKNFAEPGPAIDPRMA
jgi:hypothetical protein